MIERPVFKPTFHVEVVEAEGVFLLSEQGHFVLRGELYCVMAPLLDGRHSADDIVDALVDEATAAEVYYALGLMESKGYIVEVVAGIPPERAAFWHAAGVDPAVAEQRLRETPVSLVTAGDVASAPFADALTAMGLRLDDQGELTIVLTDDYLQGGLADINSAALASGKPWMLVKPAGTLLWIGPVFRPGVTPCWNCLAQRLRANREVESYLLGRTQGQAPFPIPRATTAASLQAAAQVVALEAAKAIAQDDSLPVGAGFKPARPELQHQIQAPTAGPTSGAGEAPALPGDGTSPSPEGKGLGDGSPGATIVTLNTLTLESRRHSVVQWPGCPACGGHGPVGARPLALMRRPKTLLAAGSHRTLTAEQVLAQYERYVSPISGVVSVLERTPSDGSGLIHAWGAGFQSNLPWREDRGAAPVPRGGGSGKGATDVEARASALCEALETYAACFHGDEPRRRASYRELGDEAIHPAACALFSAAQYRSRLDWNGQQPDVRRI